MATQPKLDIMPAEAGTDLVVAVTANPGIVLLDTEKFDAWYNRLKADAPTDADVSTNKGRDVLRSFAAKVRSEKAAIDKARLRLTKEWRDMTSQANTAGKEIEERLEGLAVEVRKPLTDWEDAEKLRVDACRTVIDGFRTAKIISEDDTAADVRARGTAVYQTALDPVRFGDMLGEAEAAKTDAIDTLKRALARLVQEEADREELARLRAEKEEADRLNAEADAAAEAERERVEAARIAEERRVTAEKAEADKIATAEQAAAQRVIDAANAEREAQEAKRSYARQIIAHIQEVGLGMIGGKTYPYGILIRELEEKIAIDDELGDMQAEVAAIRDATLTNVKAAMERQADRARREEDEARALQAAKEDTERRENKANRARVKTAAKEAIMTCGCSEETAQKIVLAIIAGEIPAVTLAF